MRTIKTTTYRIEAESGIGLFQANSGWEEDSLLRSLVCKGFSKITNMSFEFEVDNLSDYFCAFKSEKQMLEVLPFKILRQLHNHSLRIVEVKGTFLEGETQLIYKPCEVSKKVIPLSKIQKKLAKKKAMKDLKKEYKSVLVTDYIILD